jgi:hypothetical protein
MIEISIFHYGFMVFALGFSSGLSLCFIFSFLREVL